MSFFVLFRSNATLSSYLDVSLEIVFCLFLVLHKMKEEYKCDIVYSHLVGFVTTGSQMFAEKVYELLIVACVHS